MADDLVKQLKDLQRSDPDGRTQWALYCEANGNGVRDPMKHASEFIAEFLEQFHAGGRLTGTLPKLTGTLPSNSAGPQGFSDSSSQLAELVKLGQRRSQNWKQAWIRYCQSYGGGMNDPLKHEQSFLIGFLDFVAERASMSFGPSSPSYPSARAPGSSGAPDRPLKRSRLPGESAIGDPASYSSGPGSAAKDALVAKIKGFQRSSERAKHSWWDYCETNLGGVRDPMRHDVSLLEAFVARHSIA
eukprot:TRINITY_DN95924_c0_g1_i1.p1 TRINITY_DN95924_c0_g1~~TRINITY_DN95924_c0_g1_i1.p1  ORF type:complete len:244 (-),score=30.96 TRINITY_DN95924_c0_g1_i1:108-839(-)